MSFLRATSAFRNASRDCKITSVQRFSSKRSFATKKFTQDHEWIQVNGKVGTVGITDFAQNALGDVVFVDLPDVGKKIAQKETAVAVESVKAVSNVYSPASGQVSEVNDKLRDEPSLVNSGPLSDGWMFKLSLSNPAEVDSLMDEAAYKKFCDESDH